MNKFEIEWNKFIEEYGKNFGRFYNGCRRRKAMAGKFYQQGKLDMIKELNKGR